MSAPPAIGVVVITHRAREQLSRCLPVFLQSALRPRVLVVNSSSNDGTVELARELGAETLVVPRHEFNHGATRELARKHLGTEIVVMVTPDAHARDPRFLEKLVAPLLERQADISYARQIPHDGANVFEAFPREFNYPATSHVRSLASGGAWGVYLFFCSNSCAAWRNAALDAIGGFRPVLTHEDYFATARILHAGGRIAYAAEAEIHHSHRYSLRQEFQRYFDTGYVRATNRWVTAITGPAEKRGVALTAALLRRLIRTAPHLLPYACLQAGVKWLGFRTGYLFAGFPVGWCRRLSAQDYYWDSRYGQVHTRHERS